ncbi:MAG: two-component system, cell cycle response regulator [Actinomycetota bacterium]|nr:two-component system, cell cycle response regulator [Actinomycetota bacterium]
MQRIPDRRALPLVLVADDRPSVRAVFRSGLEAAGYGVVEAADGREAVAQAARNDLSVILLDVAVPGLDGHQTLAALKADESTRDVPVVFLSDRGAGDDLVQALHEGAHDYLRTPPEPAELLARVGAARRVKQLQDELRTRAVELEHVSRTDHLTGLANRRHVEEQLRSVLSAALRHAQPAAVLIIDVDHFKSVNDQRGHAAGDQVLAQIGATLRAAVRTEDLLGRWGGEEFIVVAANTGGEAVAVLAERLRAAVENASPVTVSIGGACTTEVGLRLVDVADANLYKAKAAGRNRVHVEGVAASV